MKIDLILIGKSSGGWIRDGLEEYAARLKHYTDFGVKELILPGRLTSLPAEKQCIEEGKLLLKILADYDRVTLLDERGQQFSSEGFGQYLQQQMNRSTRRHAFVVGGAYGFSEEVLARYEQRMSLSKMTFSHQMVRVFFAEQLYRAFTILRGESYHHGS